MTNTGRKNTLILLHEVYGAFEIVFKVVEWILSKNMKVISQMLNDSPARKEIVL